MDNNEGTMDFARLLVSWFVPPVGVLLQVGLKGAFWLNILLTLMCGLPGLIHATWVIATTGPGGAPQPDGSRTFWRLLLAVLIPPLAVFLQVGLKATFWLNLVLWFLGGVPGVVHAAWVLTHPD